jgi:hypothetical protein
MTQEEEDRKAKDGARDERMASRQKKELEARLTGGTVASSHSSPRDAIAKNAARRPMSSATSVQPGTESVSIKSPTTPTSRSTSKDGYVPSFAGDDGAAGLEASASNLPSVRPGAESVSLADPSLCGDMLKKYPSAVELQATLVDDEGEDQKLKRFVEKMEGRLKQQMQDLHQQQTQPQTRSECGHCGRCRFAILC